MNRTVLTAALTLSLALFGGSAFAQQPQQPQPPQQDQQQAPDGQPPFHHRHHQPNPERETARLTQQLNLSPEQATKLLPILADRDQKMAALWSNQQFAPQDKHHQMRAIEHSTRQQLEAVLTPEQLQQMRAMRHGHRRAPYGGPNGGPNGGPDQPQPPSPPSPGA
jgi:protein CpxP